MINNFLVQPLLDIENDLSYYVTKRIKEEVNKEGSSSSVRGIVYLSLSNAHRMIMRFLEEKKMSKDELANLLDVTAKNIDQLFSEKIPAGLMSKINLPLVKLYCSTKW